MCYNKYIGKLSSIRAHQKDFPPEVVLRGRSFMYDPLGKCHRLLPDYFLPSSHLLTRSEITFAMTVYRKTINQSINHSPPSVKRPGIRQIYYSIFAEYCQPVEEQVKPAKKHSRSSRAPGIFLLFNGFFKLFYHFIDISDPLVPVVIIRFP